MDNHTITIVLDDSTHFKTLAKLSLDTLADFWNVWHFENELQNPFSKIFVALFNRDPIGFLVTHITASAVIQSFAVAKEYQKLGVGTKLFEEFLKECKNQKIKTITLDVRVSNTTAIQFYSKKCFQIAHTAKNFYREPTEDAYLLLYKLQPQGENHNAKQPTETKE